MPPLSRSLSSFALVAALFSVLAASAGAAVDKGARRSRIAERPAQAPDPPTKGERAAKAALEAIGVPYRWGGASIHFHIRLLRARPLGLGPARPQSSAGLRFLALQRGQAHLPGKSQSAAPCSFFSALQFPPPPLPRPLSPYFPSLYTPPPPSGRASLLIALRRAAGARRAQCAPVAPCITRQASTDLGGLPQLIRRPLSDQPTGGAPATSPSFCRTHTDGNEKPHDVEVGICDDGEADGVQACPSCSSSRPEPTRTSSR